MGKERFYITVDDISCVSNRILISGKANKPLFKGKVGGLTVGWVRPEPLIPDRAFLNVLEGDVSKIKIGDTLYEED